MAESKEKKPPYAFILAALVLGIGLDAADATKQFVSLFESPKYAVSEEYLMVRFDSPEQMDLTVSKLNEQVSGVRFLDPDRIRSLLAMETDARSFFCSNNESTYPEAFPDQNDPKRLQLIEDCISDANSWALLATYAVKSFNSDPISDMSISYWEVANEAGYIDAFDGFIDAEIKPESDCLWGGDAEDCLATKVSAGTLIDIPTIGPGETVLMPLFVTWHFTWHRINPAGGVENLGYGGVAKTPIRMPLSVDVGSTQIIERSRPMRATANLVPGFYEGRG